MVDISLSSYRRSPISILHRRQKYDFVLLPRKWPVQMMGEIMKLCINDVS